jgi:hypothetical protein
MYVSYVDFLYLSLEVPSPWGRAWKEHLVHSAYYSTPSVSDLLIITTTTTPEDSYDRIKGNKNEPIVRETIASG